MNESARPWHWDELQQIGTDYADPKVAGAYDAGMAAFRRRGSWKACCNKRGPESTGR